MKDKDSGRRASAEPATHEPSPSVPLVSALTGECQAQDSPFWPHVRITGYAPSHRQFRLDESLTPEQITAALNGIEPKKGSGDGKCTLTWTFWAEITYKLPDGGTASTSAHCKIWDFHGARWSAYGWPEAFKRVGLEPLFVRDYGAWKYEEDGNPTLYYLERGLIAASADTHPQGGDSAQTEAPFMSGAVPSEETADASPSPPTGDDNV